MSMKEIKENIKFTTCADARDIQKLVDHRGQKNYSKYIDYGPKNDYGDYLNGLYMESAQMNSIVDTMVDYICGTNIDFNTNIRTQLKGNTGSSLKRIVRRLAFDKVLYGGFCMKLIYNKLGEIAEIEWMDLRNVRIGGDEKTAYYSETFGKGRRGEMEVYTLWEYFVPGKDENNEYACIYYNNGNSRYVYPVPMYVGSLRSIETSIEIDKFHFSSIQNNLNANTIINVNDSDNYTDEEKREVERQMRNNFSGSMNGSQFMIAWNSSKENAVSIERLADDSYDKKYESLETNTRKNIFVGFRIQPMLAGYPPENGGFSKEEYLQAFELYNTTVIKPLQKQIVYAFNELFNLTNSISISEFELTPAENISTEN